ncbi:MAG: HEAT repeat domain-containing protein [Deltaproteobacteria bacterium]|jgi:hypothetical protein|nr:HEAT repeat domain-containing protein [Deltaproteobacteria bacterium]
MLPPLLRQPDFDQALAEIRSWPPRATISPLLSCIYQVDEVVKWRAVLALAQVMNSLAGEEMEQARVVMRRLMWSLNEESGGIGWGMPEAMGEIMARNRSLAEEYGHILVSYMREECYLELTALQRGLLWGLGRLAEVYPEKLLAFDADGYMEQYLDSPDPEVRALAIRNFGLLKTPEALPLLRNFYDSPTPVHLFMGGGFVDTTVGELARQAVARIVGEE